MLFSNKKSKKNEVFELKNKFPIRYQEKHNSFREAKKIKDLHWKQTKEDVFSLNEKWSNKHVFSNIAMWDIFMNLGLVIDPSDTEMYCVSQITHSLQVVEAMEANGVTDKYILVAGLIHDVGKTLWLAGEEPCNVFCDNGIIGDPIEGSGWDNCCVNWNHDEFAYMRLKDHLPYHISWILRYHSMNPHKYSKYMNSKDIELANKYLKDFQKFDKNFKRMNHIPQVDLEKYRRYIEDIFPSPLDF